MMLAEDGSPSTGKGGGQPAPKCGKNLTKIGIIPDIHIIITKLFFRGIYWDIRKTPAWRAFYV